MSAAVTTGSRTLAALWRRAVAQEHATPAYLVEDASGWREVGWREAAARVEELGHGLLALGIGRGDPVAILGGSTLEWVLLDWALISVGATIVPIYPTSSAAECEHILADAAVVAIAVGDDGQRAKIDEIRERLPQLREVVGFDALDALAERGRAHRAEHPDALADAVAAVAEEDTLTVIYTSGTTGPPKGCVLTHRAYSAMTEMVEAMGDMMRPGERTVLYLPLAHNFGRLVSFCGARIGFTVAFCPDVRRLGGALEHVRPDWFPSVPRVYEKTYDAIRTELDKPTGVQRHVIDASLWLGRRASLARERGERYRPGLALLHPLADRLVFRKVRAKLGGRLRYGISGGAPISTEMVRFFDSIGVKILEAYGLTECTSCAINRPERYRFGTVGVALPGCEVRIAAEDGEILIRGEHVFSGYLGNEEATREVLDADGWFYSGDIGELDADGFLRITDRKKDIIATAGGKKIAPLNLENALKQQGSPYISQALVIGDRRPYITALLTLDPDGIGPWAKEHGLGGDGAALAGSPAVRELLQPIVDRVNADLARPEQIKRFAVLARDFSADEGEITPTLKLKRRICIEHFENDIEALYAGSSE